VRDGKIDDLVPADDGDEGTLMTRSNKFKPASLPHVRTEGGRSGGGVGRRLCPKEEGGGTEGGG